MEISLSVKKNVRKYWKRRARRTREKLADLDAQRETLRYELTLTKRVLEKSTDKDSREFWQMQVDFLAWDLHQTKDQMVEERSELNYCKVMLAEIRADLAAEK